MKSEQTKEKIVHIVVSIILVLVWGSSAFVVYLSVVRNEYDSKVVHITTGVIFITVGILFGVFGILINVKLKSKFS